MHSPAETGRPKAARICAAFFGVPIVLSASSAGGNLGTSLSATLTAANAPALSPSALHGLAALDIGQRILRLERDDLIEIGKRPQVLAEQRQGRAAIDVAVDVVRVELERGIEIGNGAGKIVREEPYLTASAEAAGIVGREPDRLAIVLAGAREVALAAQRIAAVEIGADVVRIELDLLIVIGNGAIVIALAVVGVAARAVDRRACTRIEPQHFGIVGDRLVVLAKLRFTAGANEISERSLRRELERSLGIGDGALRLIGNRPKIGAVDIGFGVVRSDPDSLIEILLRLLEIAFEGEDEAALRIGRGQEAALHLPQFDNSRTARRTFVGGACRPETKLPRVSGLRRLRRRLGRPSRLRHPRPQHGARDRKRGRDVADRRSMLGIPPCRQARPGSQSHGSLHGKISPCARSSHRGRRSQYTRSAMISRDG